MGMVDISGKPIVEREAVAKGTILLKHETVSLIKEGKVEKGDPLTISRISAINAVKITSNLIPFCHQIPIDCVNVDFDVKGSSITVTVKVKSVSKTGVEMEALSGVLNALLNIWDVVKKYEKDSSGNYPTTLIENVKITSKVKRQ
jgi:cyclic pyranopterin phosphate synthase